ELPWLTPASLLAVVVGGSADRNRFVRDVRHAPEEVLHLLLKHAELLLGALQQRLELLRLSEQRRHVVALRLGRADVLGDAVLRGLRLLDRGLELLSGAFQLLEPVEIERPGGARGEALRD